MQHHGIIIAHAAAATSAWPALAWTSRHSGLLSTVHAACASSVGPRLPPEPTPRASPSGPTPATNAPGTAARPTRRGPPAGQGGPLLPPCWALTPWSRILRKLSSWPAPQAGNVRARRGSPGRRVRRCP